MHTTRSRLARWSGHTPSPVAALGLGSRSRSRRWWRRPPGVAPRQDGYSQGREQQYIVTLCDGRLQSLAEISARMQLPLGVARVLVADMAADGMVAVYEPTSLDGNDAVGTELLERVLSGLRKL